MNILEDIAIQIENVQKKNGLVHYISNMVSLQDCANACLAMGSSPIMADAEEEVDEIVVLASALVLNIGTLTPRTVSSMVQAAKKAHSLGIPIILDPVGVGASSLRNQAVEKLLETVQVQVIRGNLSEISFLCGKSKGPKGVDVSLEDACRSLDDIKEIAFTCASNHQCVVAISGPVDIISHNQRLISISNGHPMLGKLTGTGCISTALTGALSTVHTSGSSVCFTATVAALLIMGIAGENAFQAAGNLGMASFRTALLDALSQMQTSELLAKARLQESWL